VGRRPIGTQNPRLTRDRHKPFSARWTLHPLKNQSAASGGAQQF
jgi:hypothetical protein